MCPRRRSWSFCGICGNPGPAVRDPVKNRKELSQNRDGHGGGTVPFYLITGCTGRMRDRKRGRYRVLPRKSGVVLI